MPYTSLHLFAGEASLNDDGVSATRTGDHTAIHITIEDSGIHSLTITATADHLAAIGEAILKAAVASRTVADGDKVYFPIDYTTAPVDEHPQGSVCRYAADPVAYPNHVCRDRDNNPTAGTDKDCWLEASAGVRDTAAVPA